MASDAVIRGLNGETPCKLMGDIQVEGVPFSIVDMGPGYYVRGVFTKYLVVPSNSIVRPKPDNEVEIVNGT
jgi:hypothetical protein